MRRAIAGDAVRFRVFKKYMCGEDLTKFQLERGAARGWRVLAR